MRERKAVARLGYPVLTKSQLTVGGRGKAGAILKCKTEFEMLLKFDELIHKEIKGELPRGILVEEIVDCKKKNSICLFSSTGVRDVTP